MKTILLMRHAKSDWGNPSLDDFDRPLAKRGRKDAPRMGKVLARFDCVPDRIISSPARRARQTAEMTAEACGYRKPIQWEESFYGGSSEDLIRALIQLPDTVGRPMLVGHNPAMEETLSTLLSGDESGWQDEFGVRLPTAALACLDADVLSWTDLEPGDGILRWFLIPKLVKAIR